MHKCLVIGRTKNNDVYSSIYSTSITAKIDKCLVVVNAFLINEQ